MSGAANIGVGLLSHTNAGKTTLARTLLRKDIGEIGDRAHVTEDAERHLLIASGRGDTLSLWDTPGFGDSMRLYSRLNKSENPMGWALSQVWDRFTDRPFWSGQQAMRSAREQCDVVLYVINAAELPEEARYIDVEMRILEWIGKPVVLVLNQLGPPRTQAQTSADMALWRTHLAAHSCIRGVLSLDAFARCWVQEDTLLAQITAVVAPELRDAGERLGAAWHARNYDVFQASMRVLAKQLAKVAVDEE
ncbi:MAG TPA: GTPase domain-containing protein, partial [Polyangiales bacterium]|nr:GTPase domain-containing protein [Polyangiales bacterium]